MLASLRKSLRSAVNLSNFEQSCHAHAAADTHGCDHIFYTAPPSLKQRMPDLSCAHHDVVVVMSTCPQDMVPINGEEMIVREVNYYVE